MSALFRSLAVAGLFSWGVGCQYGFDPMGGLDDDSAATDDDSTPPADDDSTPSDDDTTPSADDDSTAGDDDETPPPDDDSTPGIDPSACPSDGSGGGMGLGTYSASGTNYSLYIPEDWEPGIPIPVLFSQHGQGGTGEQMVSSWLSLAATEGFMVVGQDSASGNGWNFGSDVLGLQAVIEQVSTEYNIDLCRLYLHGYSAGAHWSYVIGLANATWFAGLAVYAGSLDYAVDLEVWPDGVTRSLPVRIDHGTADTTVPFTEAEQARDALEGAGHEVSFHAIEGGSHGYDAAVQPDAWEALQGWFLP